MLVSNGCSRGLCEAVSASTRYVLHAILNALEYAGVYDKMEKHKRSCKKEPDHFKFNVGSAERSSYGLKRHLRVGVLRTIPRA